MSDKQQKDAYWFPHDSNACEDPKIIALMAKYEWAGLGRWWRIIEFLRSQQGYKYNIKSKFSYTSIGKILGFNSEEATQFINDCVNEFELLKSDGDYIWSESLNERMSTWETKKQRASERGKKGAAKRWNEPTENKQEEKPRLLLPSPEKMLKDEYSKIEKTLININKFIKDNKPQFIEPYVDCWNHFASKYNLPQVKADNPARKKGFQARIKEPQFDFIAILTEAKSSNFLMIEFRMTFDWIITSPNNYIKVLEGNYKNKQKPVIQIPQNIPVGVPTKTAQELLNEQ